MDEFEFRNNIAIQENEILYLQEKSKIIYKNLSPEDTDDYDIGFGHKITNQEESEGLIYGIPFTEGITRQQALYILDQDIEKHYKLTRNFIGASAFNRLPNSAKQLFLDFSFTGVLQKFPKLKMSMFDKNLKGVLENYKRYFTYGGKRVELKRRNEFAFRLIKELIEEKYFEPLR